MSITIGQAQAVNAQARLASPQTIATAQAAANAAILAKLAPLATSIVGSQHAAVTAVTVLSRLPSVATAGSVSAAQHLAAVSWIGPLRTSVHVQGTNINTVVATVTLPPLRGTVSTTGHATVQAASRLHMATLGAVGASQSLHAASRLRLASVQTITAASSARITATLGPLGASITVQPPPSGYAADGHYYAALAARPFYATLAARSFYALSNPNVTPIFDTLDPRETAVLTFDATADLAAGETLASIGTISATQQSGIPGTLPTLTGPIINAAPITFTLNGKTITVAAGCAVQVVVTGGASGCHYLIAATCPTSNPDKVLTLKGALPVSAS